MNSDRIFLYRSVSRASLLSLLLSCSLPATALDYFNYLEEGVTVYDNLNRGVLSEEKLRDTVYHVMYRGQLASSITNFTSAALSFEVEDHTHGRYDRLNNYRTGIGLGFRTKLGVGRNVWSLRYGGKVSHSDYGDEARTAINPNNNATFTVSDDERNSRITSAFIKAEYILSERTDIAISYSDERQKAQEEYYDLESRNIGVNLNYLLRDDLVWNVGYRHRDGSLFITVQGSGVAGSTSMIARKDNKSYLNSDGRDLAYPEFGFRGWVYNIDGTSHILTTGLTYYFGENGSVDLGYELQDTSTPVGLDYRGNIYRLNLGLSF